jgi:tripeptidyl-peptidase-1
MQGVSVFYSSDDYDVPGNSGECIDPATGQYNSGASGRFNPSFPDTCPYITYAVAPQIKPGASVTQTEEACGTVIHSGGGFYNVFSMPSYQASAVANYFAKYKPTYTAQQYNNSQTTRGFPTSVLTGLTTSSLSIVSSSLSSVLLPPVRSSLLLLLA